MQYDSANEKLPMSSMQTARPATTQDYKQNSDIRKKRLIVLILLGIQLVLALIYLIARIVNLVQYYRIPEKTRDSSLASSYISNVVIGSISLVYMALFIIVVLQYLRVPILIFAWLGIVQLILVGIVIVFAIIAAVAVSAALHSFGAGVILSVIIIGIAGVTCILTILTVVYAFKLAKLIKTHQAYQYV